MEVEKNQEGRSSGVGESSQGIEIEPPPASAGSSLYPPSGGGVFPTPFPFQSRFQPGFLGGTNGREGARNRKGRVKRPRRVFCRAGVSPHENRSVIQVRIENPHYQAFFPLSHSPGLQPLQNKAPPPWDDAPLAPGWDKSARWRFNCGLQE